MAHCLFRNSSHLMSYEKRHSNWRIWWFSHIATAHTGHLTVGSESKPNRISDTQMLAYLWLILSKTPSSERDIPGRTRQSVSNRTVAPEIYHRIPGRQAEMGWPRADRYDTQSQSRPQSYERDTSEKTQRKSNKWSAINKRDQRVGLSYCQIHCHTVGCSNGRLVAILNPHEGERKASPLRG